ncbi:LysR substrate-binding domain-containing protein [Nocardioides sp.]|uniref:LysR substrate-binding domain-containing protein n=1 Tax=Nocardioides sp. TaxID=35761 RepID=UPI003516B0F4
MSSTSPALRLGYVIGATPDKWARAWRERRPEPLILVPLEEHEQADAVTGGEVDMAIARLPLDSPADLHRLPLYEEEVVAMGAKEGLLGIVEHEVALADLADEQLVMPHRSGWTPTADQLPWPPMGYRDAVETVAAGTGIVLLPASVARLLQRRDVVTRRVPELDPTAVALVWRRDRDGEDCQAFVGIVRGRTARSSRG